MSQTTLIQAAIGRQALMPELLAQVRYAGADTALAGTISTAVSTGNEHSKAVTDQGTIDTFAATIRYSSALEPATWKAPAGTQAYAIEGQPVEVKFPGDTAWTRCRVRNRFAIAGMVRLNIVAEFEDL